MKSVHPPIPEFEAFRPLDRAPAAIVQGQQFQIQSEATMHRIMQTSSSSNISHPSHKAIRWAAIPIAAAAAIGLGIALPGAPGAAPAQAGMNTWTAHTQPVTGDALTAADAACRKEIQWSADQDVQDQLVNGAWPGTNGEIVHRPGIPDGPIVTDQRGDWGLLGYAQEDGVLAVCLTLLGDAVDSVVPAAGTVVTSSVALWSTGYSASFYAMLGTADSGPGMNYDPETFTEPAADSIDIRNQLEAAVGEDAAVEAPYSGRFTIAGGRVGADVTGVTLDTSSSGPVDAAVDNGWWLAWWPGEQGGGNVYWAQSDGIETGARMVVASSYTVTLRDGSQVTAVPQNWGIDCSLDWSEPCFYTREEAEAFLAR